MQIDHSTNEVSLPVPKESGEINSSQQFMPLVDDDRNDEKTNHIVAVEERSTDPFATQIITKSVNPIASKQLDDDRNMERDFFDAKMEDVQMTPAEQLSQKISNAINETFLVDHGSLSDMSIEPNDDDISSGISFRDDISVAGNSTRDELEDDRNELENNDDYEMIDQPYTLTRREKLWLERSPNPKSRTVKFMHSSQIEMSVSSKEHGQYDIFSQPTTTHERFLVKASPISNFTPRQKQDKEDYHRQASPTQHYSQHRIEMVDESDGSIQDSRKRSMTTVTKDESQKKLKLDRSSEMSEAVETFHFTIENPSQNQYDQFVPLATSTQTARDRSPLKSLNQNSLHQQMLSTNGATPTLNSSYRKLSQDEVNGGRSTMSENYEQEQTENFGQAKVSTRASQNASKSSSRYLQNLLPQHTVQTYSFVPPVVATQTSQKTLNSSNQKSSESRSEYSVPPLVSSQVIQAKPSMQSLIQNQMVPPMTASLTLYSSNLKSSQNEGATPMVVTQSSQQTSKSTKRNSSQSQKESSVPPPESSEIAQAKPSMQTLIQNQIVQPMTATQPSQKALNSLSRNSSENRSESFLLPPESSLVTQAKPSMQSLIQSEVVPPMTATQTSQKTLNSSNLKSSQNRNAPPMVVTQSSQKTSKSAKRNSSQNRSEASVPLLESSKVAQAKPSMQMSIQNQIVPPIPVNSSENKTKVFYPSALSAETMQGRSVQRQTTKTRSSLSPASAVHSSARNPSEIIDYFVPPVEAPEERPLIQNNSQERIDKVQSWIDSHSDISMPEQSSKKMPKTSQKPVEKVEKIKQPALRKTSKSRKPTKAVLTPTTTRHRLSKKTLDDYSFPQPAQNRNGKFFKRQNENEERVNYRTRPFRSTVYGNKNKVSNDTRNEEEEMDNVQTDGDGRIYDDKGCVFANEEELQSTTRFYIERDGLEYMKTKAFKSLNAVNREKIERKFRTIHTLMNHGLDALHRKDHKFSEIDPYAPPVSECSVQRKRKFKSKIHSTNEVSVTISTQNNDMDQSNKVSVAITHRRVSKIYIVNDDDTSSNSTFQRSNVSKRQKGSTKPSNDKQFFKKPKQLPVKKPQSKKFDDIKSSKNVNSTLNVTPPVIAEQPRKLPIYASQKMKATYRNSNRENEVVSTIGANNLTKTKVNAVSGDLAENAPIIEDSFAATNEYHIETPMAITEQQRKLPIYASQKMKAMHRNANRENEVVSTIGPNNRTKTKANVVSVNANDLTENAPIIEDSFDAFNEDRIDECNANRPEIEDKICDVVSCNDKMKDLINRFNELNGRDETCEDHRRIFLKFIER